jgi:hypothetical protein
MKRHHLRPLAHQIVAAATLLVTGSAHAAVDTWIGNVSVNWADLNWAGGNNPPVSGDSLIFGLAGTAGSLLNNNLTPPFSVAGLTFNADANSYTFAGNSVVLTATRSTTARACRRSISIFSWTPRGPSRLLARAVI